MNLSEYANHRKALGLVGTTHAAVSYAISSGRLPGSAKRVGVSGWDIDAELADQEWSLNTHRRQRLSMAPDSAAAAATTDTPPPFRRKRSSLPAHGPDNIPNIVHSEATKRGAEANLKVLDLQQRMGTLVEASRVRALVFTRHRQFRDAVQGIPSRVVDSIVATIGDLSTDKRHAIRTLVSAECRRVLEDLAKNPLKFDDDASR